MTKPTKPPQLSLKTWKVQITAHTVAGRYPIPAATVKLPAANERQAMLFAVREAHSKAGVPPWKPCVRESLRYATVTSPSKPAQSEPRAA